MTAKYEPKDHVPLPPKDASVHTTACDYCIVGCGYKAFVWPKGREGGPGKAENALGIDFPVPALSGRWPSPNQHNECLVGGKKHNVIVLPDPDATVVNRGGNHSIRGGCLAQKVYNPDGPTADRLKTPQIRVNGTLVPVSWDAAFDIMAGVSRHVLSNFGESAWAMKTYSYQYFENTYAISKLAFESIQTPAYSEHDKPGPGNDTAGVDDSGIVTFSASYHDWEQAAVLFISGTDPYETKTIIFTEWMMKGAPNKIIMVNPRRTAGAAYAEKTGGLYLPIIPGTDTILHLALARIILENGWEDREFIDHWIATKWEIDSGFGRGPRNTPVEWRTTWDKIGVTDFAAYKEWLLAQPYSDLNTAAQLTGIPAKKIRATAELIAKPIGGVHPKTSFGFEKGNYWSNNYLNTASFAALALLCGAGNRPGRVISRLGGHQRGWASNAASYPRIQSPNKYQGRRKQEIDLDRWVEAGHVRFAYVIGTTWLQAMAASQELARTFQKLTRDNPHQVSSSDASSAVDALKKRADSGGMVVVHQDIYPVDPIATEYADLVLPAATWGEEDFSRANGERRIRLYSKFCDAPGEAKPDWWIISGFARKMGFKDYDWKDSNQVFEEGARFSRGGVLNYHPLVWYAKQIGMRGHDVLRAMGTRGIQGPVRFREKPTENAEYLDYAGFFSSPKRRGMIVGTKRLHDPDHDFGAPEGPTVHQKWLSAFGSHSGKALLHKTPWDLYSDFFERITPREDELWVTSGRINERWQSAFDDSRRPYIMQRWPGQFVEVHSEDAQKRGIESGDEVLIWSDDVLIQTGGFVATKDGEMTYTELEKAGRIRIGHGEFKGVAIVTDDIRPGVVFADFLWPAAPANSVVHRVPDPITLRYRFKLGKGRIKKIGESPYKKTFDEMSFAPRTVM
ncbi:MAG: arsenite oxidase large subunit [Candidatus Lindowbacteria bacterium RIFCSPLOWO2_12_FULL_62_27]|nr:MAG: arsenite oxidase large subunit [Candidatus Lindowbacteria bacterium RIFCSPLOWO2_02_FULL_62_12]OGH62377.1 MAG: arsenite oxidase large subunit [Candidatus Lindowbacteria bacterium RIFCSPLOWO2_12_FULL_62_27]